MPRGGPNGGGRPKGRKDSKPRRSPIPQSLREWALKEFDARFRHRFSNILDTMDALTSLPDPDPQMVRYVADRILGRQGAMMELPGGQGVQSVEITYKVVHGA